MTVDDIYDAVMDYDDERVVELIEAELDAGTDVNQILDDGLIAALDDIGEQFAEGLTFVPQMLMAAEAVQAGMNILRPVLVKSGAKPKGTVVIGTVKGDLHDIGKNLVGILLEGAGFNVIDLGTNVDADAFINSAQESEADLIAISGLLTTSMHEIENAVAEIAKANQTRNMNVKVMVGGPPVNQLFATKIGADGFGETAPDAVEAARSLVGQQH
jgi:5-methyltetrahydrofolate--homocysteine methyltransferase